MVPPYIETEWGITSFQTTDWYMPERRIKKNYRSVTGVFASQKSEGVAEFESTLERDLFSLLEFSPDVLSYEVQPVTIGWTDSEGRNRRYTPDVLVRFKNLSTPFLLEAKYREDLHQDWSNLNEKHLAAKRWAKEKGMKFNVITEISVRGVYLENARFLLGYRHPVPPVEMMTLVKGILKSKKRANAKFIVETAFSDDWRQAQLLTVLWYLVSTFQIKANLNEKLTMESELVWKA